MQIDADLVRSLVAEQFPAWAGLPVRAVTPGGWDNRTFRLGDDLSVRLPSAEGYAVQVAKEQRWLPVLAPRLPLPIPLPVAAGAPGCGYPYPWSVLRWIPGETVTASVDLVRFAGDLAAFLRALAAVDAAGGPAAGAHSWYRGASLTAYDRATRDAARTLDLEREALPIWEGALATAWAGAPVWFHGDVAAGNLLVRDDRLSAVIDFGCCGVGDPACDLVIAWTLLSGDSRAAFRSATGADDGTWARGRAWALWKALILVAGGGPSAGDARATLAEILAG